MLEEEVSHPSISNAKAWRNNLSILSWGDFMMWIPYRLLYAHTWILYLSLPLKLSPKERRKKKKSQANFSKWFCVQGHRDCCCCRVEASTFLLFTALGPFSQKRETGSWTPSLPWDFGFFLFSSGLFNNTRTQRETLHRLAWRGPHQTASFEERDHTHKKKIWIWKSENLPGSLHSGRFYYLALLFSFACVHLTY